MLDDPFSFFLNIVRGQFARYLNGALSPVHYTYGVSSNKSKAKRGKRVVSKMEKAAQLAFENRKKEEVEHQCKVKVIKEAQVEKG